MKKFDTILRPWNLESLVWTLFLLHCEGEYGLMMSHLQGIKCEWCGLCHKSKA